MTQVEIEVTVKLVVECSYGQRSLESIQTTEGKVLAKFEHLHPATDGAVLNAFEDQISEALVWAKADDQAAWADSQNEQRRDG